MIAGRYDDGMAVRREVLGDSCVEQAITLTALIARGHHDELAVHLRAALRNGLTPDEIKEVLLQAAVYCGVRDANAAFRIAQRVLEEIDGQHDAP